MMSNTIFSNIRLIDASTTASTGYYIPSASTVIFPGKDTDAGKEIEPNSYKPKPSISSFGYLSLNGIDDKTDLEWWVNAIGMSRRYYNNNIHRTGILISNKKQGQPRYLSYNGILKFFKNNKISETRKSETVIPHFCGDSVFDYILNKGFANEISRCCLTVQINIDASDPLLDKPRFIEKLHEKLLDNHHIILQYNENNIKFIKELTDILVTGNTNYQLHLLEDSSLGKNIPMAMPRTAPINPYHKSFLTSSTYSSRGAREKYGVQKMGYAGGINESNLYEIMHSINEKYKALVITRGYNSGAQWIDVESGIRNDQNEIDKTKVERLINVFRDIRQGSYCAPPTEEETKVSK